RHVCCEDGSGKCRNCTRRCVYCADGREKSRNCTRRHVCCEDGREKCRNCTRKHVYCADGREKSRNCTRRHVCCADGRVNCDNCTKVFPESLLTQHQISSQVSRHQKILLCKRKREPPRALFSLIISICPAGRRRRFYFAVFYF